MGATITIANRKGGVGKTTLTIALAETFVFEHKKNVAIVDLDPQSSASEILLSELEYADRIESSKVLPDLLSRWSEDTEQSEFQRFVSGAKHSLIGRGNVDLAVLANSPQLWDLEYEVLRSGRENGYRAAVRRLLASIRSEFDVVIVDCPPGKMIASEEAILSSSMVLCPIVPERLSVWGMDKMKEYFEQLSLHHELPDWRFLISRYTANTNEAKQQVEQIRGAYPDLFLKHKVGVPGFNRRREFVAIDRAEIMVKRIAKFRDNPDEVKNLEQFYGPTVTAQLRTIAKQVKEICG